MFMQGMVAVSEGKETNVKKINASGAGATKLHILPYKGQTHYELKINGYSWNLPLISVGNETWIAYFDSLGDVRLIRSSAKTLAEQMGDCEILITSESKGIALAHEIAGELGQDNFVVCRKEVKPSMVNPLVVKYRPITSPKDLQLCLDSKFAKMLDGKRVGLVDDIVSTRATIDAMEKLVMMAGGRVVKRAAILVEGAPQADILHVGILPIFKK
jgi:adenine phosphoribosyltransferase